MGDRRPDRRRRRRSPASRRSSSTPWTPSVVNRSRSPGVERFLDHVHVGRARGCRPRWSARAASGDVRSSDASVRGSFAIIVAIHESSPVSWRSRPPPSRYSRLSPTCADRQPAVDDQRRDDGRAHAGVGAELPASSRIAHVREVNRGPEQIAGFGQRRIEAERPADRAGRRAMTSSTASTAECRGNLAGVVAAHAVGDRRRGRGPRRSRSNPRWWAGPRPCR